MYRIIVNNGFTLLDSEYESLVFNFKDIQEAIVFIKCVFQYGENCGIEINYLKESDN